MLDGELRIIRNVVMEGDTDENGEVRHAMIFLRDVTDSKNAEKRTQSDVKAEHRHGSAYSGSNQDCRAFCSL